MIEPGKCGRCGRVTSIFDERGYCLRCEKQLRSEVISSLVIVAVGFVIVLVLVLIAM